MVQESALAPLCFFNYLKYIKLYLFNFILIMAEEEHEHDQNQEQFKKLHCRMYENKYPKENELVYVSYINFNIIKKHSAKLQK